MGKTNVKIIVERCLKEAGAFACKNEAEERMWCTPNFLPPIDHQLMRDAMDEALSVLKKYKPVLDASKPWDGVVFEMSGTRVHAPGVSFYIFTRWLEEHKNAANV